MFAGVQDSAGNGTSVFVGEQYSTEDGAPTFADTQHSQINGAPMFVDAPFRFENTFSHDDPTMLYAADYKVASAGGHAEKMNILAAIYGR